MKWPGPRIAAAAAALLVAGGATLWALQRPATPPSDDTPVAPLESGSPSPPPQPEGRIVQVECRQGACQWARIVEIAPVAAGGDGELRRLTYRPGSSMDDGSAGAGSAIDWSSSDRSDYAYCSTVRPAFAFPDEAGNADGALIVHHLDLFDLGGYQFASAKLYGLVCHDLDAVVEAEPALRALGYRPGTRSDQTRAASPDGLLRR